MHFVFISVIVVVLMQSTTAAVSEGTCGGQTRQSGYIFGGSHSSRGEFPWMVALMLAKFDPPMFIGGGTLVSSRHVITGWKKINYKFFYRKFGRSSPIGFFFKKFLQVCRNQFCSDLYKFKWKICKNYSFI